MKKIACEAAGIVMRGVVSLIREFKIVHYGRLGRMDAYTGGLGP